jgi:hypothetical protein
MDGAEWLRTQLTSFGCAACGQPYEAGRIAVLAERDGLFFVDLACAHCGTQAVAMVTIQIEDDDARVDPVDLPRARRSTEELREPGPDPAPAISADDVIEVHQLLQSYDGDMQGLLRRMGGEPRRR